MLLTTIEVSSSDCTLAAARLRSFEDIKGHFLRLVNLARSKTLNSLHARLK